MATFTPRYCLLQKGSQGYGFNLHGEAPEKLDDPNAHTRFYYHIIKSVDENSPAEIGGLRKDDRLIGVNGKYVDQRPHNEVVDLIKAGGSSTYLMVVDRETDDYFLHNVKRKPKFSDSVYGHIDKRGLKVDVNEIPMEEELMSEADKVFPGDGEDEADEGEQVKDEEDHNKDSAEQQEEEEESAPPVEAEAQSAVSEDGQSQSNHDESRNEDVAENGGSDEAQENQEPVSMVGNGKERPDATQISQSNAPLINNDPFGDLSKARAAAKGHKHDVKVQGSWKNKWSDFNQL